MISLEQKKYLRKRKINKLLVITVQLFILIFFIFLWQFLADKSLINTFITSSPRKVLETIIELYQTGNLFNHIYITIYETIVSFLIGTISGIIIAILMYNSPFFSKVIDPYLTILNSLPKVALGPIIIIWAGAGMKSIIIMALLISLIITIVTVYGGFQSTDQTKIKLLKSLKASKYQILKLLVLPNSYPTIISSLKINISMSLIGVIMGEFLVSKEGIGYLIIYGSQVFNLSLVLAGIIILMLLSYLMYITISIIEKILIKNG